MEKKPVSLDLGFDNLEDLDIDLQVLASAESLALPELGGSRGTSGCCTYNCGTVEN